MTVFEFDLEHTESSIRRLIKYFVGSLIILVGGVGGWAVLSKVESAVVTTGTFVVKSSGQAVQHLQGGVIGKILVKEGDRVRKGQLVVQLDAAQVRAKLAIINRQLIETTAERARLLSERDGRSVVPRPKLKLSQTKRVAALETALALQQTLLTARQSALRSQLSQLSEQKMQIESQISGLRSLLSARKEELIQVKADLSAYQTLDKKRLIRRSVLRQTKRQVSRLRGDVWEIKSRLTAQRSRLTETQFRIREIKRKSRSEILDRLQVVRAKIGELLEQHKAAVDRTTRLEIRAPSAGVVHEMKIHTVGGVIPPGQSVMTIVPDDDPLVLHARIKTSEIDQVKIGQKSTARISAFKRQKSAELAGTVIAISPDRSQDDRTGTSYFTVKIAIEPGEEKKLGTKRLTAGLPADVFIRGEARRVITYLTQPLFDQMGSAFREE